MLEFTIMQPEGILVLKPQGRLSKADFEGLSASVDSYLADHPKLHGVMVHAKEFPGWEGVGGFSAHLRFVGGHRKKVERIAIVTDSPAAEFAESLGRPLTGAEVMHFPYPDDEKALAWLEAG